MTTETKATKMGQHDGAEFLRENDAETIERALESPTGADENLISSLGLAKTAALFGVELDVAGHKTDDFNVACDEYNEAFDAVLSASQYRVHNYDTGAEVEGRADAGLIEESMKAGDTGAVPACRDARGTWMYIAPDQVSATQKRGTVVVTVFVERV